MPGQMRAIILIFLIFLILINIFFDFFEYKSELIQRVLLGGVRLYETKAPDIPTGISRPAILVLTRTNGFRHDGAIPAANKMLAAMATENGWGLYQTENGAAFEPAILAI